MTSSPRGRETTCWTAGPAKTRWRVAPATMCSWRARATIRSVPGTASGTSSTAGAALTRPGSTEPTTRRSPWSGNELLPEPAPPARARVHACARRDARRALGDLRPACELQQQPPARTRGRLALRAPARHGPAGRDRFAEQRARTPAAAPGTERAAGRGGGPRALRRPARRDPAQPRPATRRAGAVAAHRLKRPSREPFGLGQTFWSDPFWRRR